MRKYIFLALISVALISVNYWAQIDPPPVLRVYSGKAMGAAFSVTWVETKAHPSVQLEVDAILQRITDQMSTYKPDSQLSQFNRFRGVEWFDVSTEVVAVIAIAQEVSSVSDGVFDVTVKPLVAAWGFGPDASSLAPSEAQLALVANTVGYQYLELRQSPPALRKRIPELQVDLNGIAPGYAVDQISVALTRLGIDDYLVDVGGELRIAGHKAPGVKWRIAIETPEAAGAATDSAYELEATSLGTSGDYRNYYERDGQRFSHTIDPRTRRPIAHRLASVTVLAKDCAHADAFATVLNVLGPDDGFKFAQHNQLSTLMLIRTEAGTFEHRRSGFFASDTP